MVVYDEKTNSPKVVPKEITELYNNWLSAKGTSGKGGKGWKKQAEEGWQYFMNNVDGTYTLYTQDQLTNIENITDIPVSVNFIYPITSQKVSMLTRKKPSHRIITEDGSMRKTARELDDMKFKVQYGSKANSQNEMVFKDMLTAGLAHKFVGDSTLFAPGEFGITSRYVSHDHVILDATVEDVTFDDTMGFFLEKWLPVPKVKAQYEKLVNKVPNGDKGHLTIDDLLRASNSFTKDSMPKVWIREFWQPIYTAMFLIEDKDGLSSGVFRENVDEEFRLLNNLDQETNKEYLQTQFWQRRLFIEEYEIDVEVKPYTQCPLITYVFEWGKTPYDSLGMVHFVKGNQQAIDKMIQMFIANGMLNNQKSYRSPIGGIPPDKADTWRTTNPYVIKEYNIVVAADGKSYVPEQESVEPLSPFYPTIIELLKAGMHTTTGVTPIIQGDAAEAKVDVFSSLQTYQDNAMSRVLLTMQHVNESQEAEGNALIEQLVWALIPGKKYPYYNERDRTYTEVVFDRKTIEILRRTKFALQAVASEGAPNQRLAMAIEFAKIAQSSQDPMDRKEFMMEAIRLAELYGTEEVFERIDTAKQLQGQIQQLSSQLERQTELLKQAENAQINAEKEARLMNELVKILTSLARAEGLSEGQIKAKLEEFKTSSQEKSS
jgi:hypothetical protein